MLWHITVLARVFTIALRYLYSTACVHPTRLYNQRNSPYATIDSLSYSIAYGYVSFMLFVRSLIFAIALMQTISASAAQAFNSVLMLYVVQVRFIECLYAVAHLLYLSLN